MLLSITDCNFQSLVVTYELELSRVVRRDPTPFYLDVHVVRINWTEAINGLMFRLAMI